MLDFRGVFFQFRWPEFQFALADLRFKFDRFPPVLACGDSDVPFPRMKLLTEDGDEGEDA